LVDHRIGPGGTRGVDHGERFHRRPPRGLADHLVMRQHDGDVRALADLECLSDTLEQAEALLAEVRRVEAPHPTGDFGESHHLVQLGEGARQVLEARGDRPCALVHGLRDHPLHALKLARRGGSVLQTHDLAPYGVVPDHEAHIHPDSNGRGQFQVLCERPRPPPVGSTQCGRHALPHMALGAGQPQQRVEVRMQIDESGSYDQPGCVDRAARPLGIQGRARGVRETLTIRSSTIATSAEKPGRPVPFITVPP